jgi:hypothetical protein
MPESDASAIVIHETKGRRKESWLLLKTDHFFPHRLKPLARISQKLSSPRFVSASA